MVTWLRDRYEDEIADKITELDSEDSALAEKICEILGVEYNEEVIANLEKIEERNKKLSILKEYTEEQQFLDVVDQVAFTQDDIYDLLDEGETIIYLCGEKFSVPLSKKGMTYIGVNQPTVVIDSKKIIDWDEKDIRFVDVKFDKVYQKIVEDVKQDSERVDNRTSYGSYKETYLKSMLSEDDKVIANHCYEKLISEIIEFNFDIEEKNVKFVAIVDYVNVFFIDVMSLKKIFRYRSIIDGSKVRDTEEIMTNTGLAMIFDYEKLNDYGKEIMKYSHLHMEARSLKEDFWFRVYPNMNDFKNKEYKIQAAKLLKNLCKQEENSQTAHKFLLWTIWKIMI
ncbi:MAG: hypothetical protein R3Y24_01185 [Eubacteriales bacterium]